MRAHKICGTAAPAGSVPDSDQAVSKADRYRPDGGPLLSVENLDAFYGKTHVLRDVSLSVPKRDSVALMGRNGTGKTTILLCIMGLGPTIEKGTISFSGKSLLGRPPEQIFNLGISWVPAERRIFPNLTVDENLRMGFRKDLDSDRYQELRETLNLLNDREDQRAGTLSGGQKQLLTIARGLVSDPDLVLIDEAFEGLMPSIIPEVQTLLRQAKEWGAAVLVAGQSTNVILDVVDRVYIIENGAIEAEVDASALIQNEKLRQQYFGVGT
jgi:branched-chain amino acid transport system ATP-binding protein